MLCFLHTTLHLTAQGYMATQCQSVWDTSLNIKITPTHVYCPLMFWSCGSFFIDKWMFWSRSTWRETMWCVNIGHPLVAGARLSAYPLLSRGVCHHLSLVYFTLCDTTHSLPPLSPLCLRSRGQWGGQYIPSLLVAMDNTESERNQDSLLKCNSCLFCFNSTQVTHH